MYDTQVEANIKNAINHPHLNQYQSLISDFYNTYYKTTKSSTAPEEYCIKVNLTIDFESYLATLSEQHSLRLTMNNKSVSHLDIQVCGTRDNLKAFAVSLAKIKSEQGYR
jgi:hypothetical protein